MTPNRAFNLYVDQTVIPMPCFFPSVSSVKTNMMPVDYVELLDASAHPMFLASAYDVAHCSPEQRARIVAALHRSKTRGKAIFMDSGNYESFWKNRLEWTSKDFHQIIKTSEHDLCFCYDNQEPPNSAEAIAYDVVARVLQDQEHALGTVIPIIHGSAELLPVAVRNVAEQLYPLLVAVPERALGDGIIARTRSIRKLREALNELGFYCPLHLLGTGNPLSIATYAMAGADSFDGLEWCQTVVDHETGKLFHFQQWDVFREQTNWGYSGGLPYIQSVLMHNLEFYQKFMEELRDALLSERADSILRRYLPERQATLLINATKGIN